ncbi:MAG: family 1 encapsulin nanocompartment shell protein [Armatimonadota bacterium]
MGDYLARDASPLSDEQWQQLDELVVSTAKKLLVGRRVLPLYGPLGAGPAGIPTPQLATEPGVVRVARTALVELHENVEDFVVDWKEIERAKRLDVQMDWAAAVLAAARCADHEDALIFGGCDDCGHTGLLKAEGALQLTGGDWSEADAMYQDVVSATSRLMAEGHPGPFALVLSPSARALIHRFVDHGMMLHRMIEEQVSAGVFTSRHVPDETMLVMCVGSQVADLGVGVDLTVAYLGNEGMTHLFRVFETIVPRVKQPNGLCIVNAAK